jgi:hypothetical protein
MKSLAENEPPNGDCDVHSSAGGCSRTRTRRPLIKRQRLPVTNRDAEDEAALDSNQVISGCYRGNYALDVPRGVKLEIYRQAGTPIPLISTIP